MRALLVARKQLLGRLVDVELSIRGILRGFGLKVGQATRNEFEARIRELVIGQATLERIAGAGSLPPPPPPAEKARSPIRQGRQGAALRRRPWTS